MSIILFAAAFAATATAATPAPAKGYEVEVIRSGLVCLRPTTPAEGVRLDIPLNRRECRSETHWQLEGLTIERVAKG